MTDQNEANSSEKKRRKWPWVIPLGILVLIGLLRLFLMTGPAHRLIKNEIIKAANKGLKPRLTIGRLKGNILHKVTLTDVRLSESQDSTVASIDTLHIKYHLLSYFSHTFKINDIQIIAPLLKLRQEKDSTWNLQHWFITPSDTTTTGGGAYSIANFSVKRGKIHITNLSLQQQSDFNLDNITLASSHLFYSPGHYGATIDSLNFNIKKTHLDSPASVSFSADANDSTFALHKLSIRTGHSHLQTSGRANFQDSTADFQMEAQPLGWKDVAAYMKNVPVQHDIQTSLQLKEQGAQFEAHLNANAPGLNNLAVSTKFHRGSTISLTALQASAQEINLKTLLGDTTTQQLQDLKIQARGKVPFSDYQHSSLKGSFSAKNMREQVYHLDALQGALSLDNDKATIQVEPVEKGQHVVGRVTLGKIWTENPSVGVSVQGSGINPAIWMRNKEYTGSVNFSANLSGEGWYPRQKMWNYQLTIHNSSLMGQALEKATLNGKFSQNSILNQSDITIASGRLHLNAEAHDIQTLPVFSYSLQARSINLAGLKGLSSYPSVINGSIQGNGRGNSLQNLQLTTTAAIDSSVFKKEPFQKLKFTMNVADSVVTISDAVMQSAIADGTLSGRVHLGHWYDANNKLNFQAKIKDLSPFAPMAGVKILRAKGTMNGQIEPAGSDSLVFDSNLQLHDINYGNEFTAQKMNGKARVSLEKNPRYSVDITIAKPTISSANLESIDLKTRGRVAGAETSGSYKIDLAGAGKNRSSQGGSYRMSGDTTAAEISKFTLTGNKRTLALAKPFHIKMINSTVQTDTLRLSSKDGATYIALAVPYADSLRQKGYVKAQQIQLAPIQNALFNEKYVEGAVFGDVHFDHSADDMTASGNIVLSDLSYAGAKLDSLRLQATIKNKQLQGKLTARKNGKEILEGQANIPFSMQRPGKLKSDFSRQPVEGHLTVQPIALSEFQTWMKKAGISGTKGTFQFHGTLSGEVSNPSFNANLSLKNANLSGVPIDSLTASAHYQNEQSMLNFKAAVTSLHHQALNIDGKFPFKINLQNFSMSMPGPNSKLALQVGANKFDLKTLDGFLNRKMARNLQGRIDGHVDISGPRDNLSTNGQLTLQEGAIRLVTAGIRIDHIQSTFQFQPDKIVFSKLDMRSGKGSLHARGQLGLKNLTAQNLDVSIKAQNFKAANTKNYNAVVDANLNMSGKLTSPKITGNLNVMDGFVKLNNFGQKSVENVQLDTTMTPETQTSLYDSLSLNMNISLNRRFYVRNSRYLKMEIGLNGKLSLQKNPGKDMQIFGTLNTVNGYAEPLGKHFNIQKGTIAFSGPPSNPELDIRTLYEPPQTNQSVKIWYIIQGTVKDPKFEYNSDPPMDLSSILSYTLFGQPIYSLNPAAQSVAGSAGGGNVATNFAMQLLMNRLESLANQKLGIDVVKIENVQVGGKSGTSVTTGWYINPKVFFAIQNVITGSTPSPGFYLEYYIKKNLKLILSQGTNNRDGVGADLEWKHDY